MSTSSSAELRFPTASCRAFCNVFSFATAAETSTSTRCARDALFRASARSAWSRFSPAVSASTLSWTSRSASARTCRIRSFT